mgnify:CR=1 FL=1
MSERPLIYIPDASYDNPDYYDGLDEIQASKMFLNETSKRFELPAREANIGAGADWPAVALEAIEYIKERDAVLLGIALFFSGKKINDNLDAWLSIGQKLKNSLAGCRSVLNRSASILLALRKHKENSGSPLKNIELHQYEALDGRGVESLASVHARNGCTISEEADDERLGGIIHYFRIEINDDELEILVRGTDVLIRKTENDI